MHHQTTKTLTPLLTQQELETYLFGAADILRGLKTITVFHRH